MLRLMPSGPDEIKGFASIRALGNKIPDSVRGVALITLLLVVLFPVAAQNNLALQVPWARAPTSLQTIASPRTCTSPSSLTLA